MHIHPSILTTAAPVERLGPGDQLPPLHGLTEVHVTPAGEPVGFVRKPQHPAERPPHGEPWTSSPPAEIMIIPVFEPQFSNLRAVYLEQHVTVVPPSQVFTASAFVRDGRSSWRRVLVEFVANCDEIAELAACPYRPELQLTRRAGRELVAAGLVDEFVELQHLCLTVGRASPWLRRGPLGYFDGYTFTSPTPRCGYRIDDAGALCRQPVNADGRCDLGHPSRQRG